MIKRIVAVSALIPAMLGVTSGVASAQSAPKATAAVVTLTYDASQAAQWASAITLGAQNWNGALHNVRLQPASSRSSANFVYKATSGWPQTTLGPFFPGGSRGQVQLGQEAVDEGYDMTRIAAHETGHILGLPDHYTGPCSELMSGHGPGTSCTNAKPTAAEAAQVDRNYAGRIAARTANHQIVIDIWSAPAPARAH